MTAFSAERNKRGSDKGEGMMTGSSFGHGLATYMDAKLVNAIRIKVGTYVPPPPITKPKDPDKMFYKTPITPFTRPVAKLPPFVK